MAWLSGYLYRKAITLTGGSDGAQTDFQLKLATAFVTDHMQSDFDDLRFTDADGNLIDAWLEEKTDGTSADVWVEFPSTPANAVTQTYYMYYGKADDVSNWDIAATFLFGDDFPGTSIDTSKWDGKTSNAAVSGGIMSYGGDNTQDRLKSITQFNSTVALRAKLKMLQPSSYIDAYGLENPDLSHQARCHVAYTPVNYGVTEDGTTLSSVDTNTPLNSWFTGDIIVVGGSSVSWFYDGTEGTNSPKTTNPPNTNDLEVSFLGRETSACVQSEWVLVRKYAANPPTYAFGSEESAITILDFERAGMRGVMRGIMRGVV